MEISVPVKTTVVVKPFIELVRLVAMSFYDDYSTNDNNEKKSATNDNRGIAVVVLNALTRRQWVSEEDLVTDLKMGSTKIRKIMRYFQEEKLVTHYGKNERAKPKPVAAKTYGRAEDKANKVSQRSYYCLDYPLIYDIVRLKLHRIRKKLKDEQEDKNTVQQYVCPRCKRKYSALEAQRLLFMEDYSFRCEKCHGELVAECNKLTSEEGKQGQKKDLLQSFEVQMKRLMDQINRVKDLPVPKLELFPEWEARAARENRHLNPNDPLRSEGGSGSTPMPYLGETEVEVNLGERTGDVKSKGGDSSVKVLPPWMMKKGMNLTDEQRGLVRHEAEVDYDGSEKVEKLSDNEKSAMGNDDDADLKDEYLKAYCAALVKAHALVEKPDQQEPAGELTTREIQSVSTTSSDRQVGVKAKREEEDEEDVEWEEEAPVPGNGNMKVDLYVEEEEEEDDVGWEEG